MGCGPGQPPPCLRYLSLGYVLSTSLWIYNPDIPLTLIILKYDWYQARAQGGGRGGGNSPPWASEKFAYRGKLREKREKRRKKGEKREKERKKGRKGNILAK